MKNLFSSIKAKILAVVGLGAVAATNAAAAISMDNTGAVTGSFELGTFYGVAGAVLAAAGVIWAVKAGIRIIRG